MDGLCSFWTTGYGRAEATSVEEAERDEVVGGSEPVGHAGEETELGVGRLHQCVRQYVVGQGGDDGVAVAEDPPVEVDEGGDAISPGPGTPGIEGGNGLYATAVGSEAAHHHTDIEGPPVPPPVALVVAGGTHSTPSATALGRTPRADVDNHRIGLVVEVDLLDHRDPVDAEHFAVGRPGGFGPQQLSESHLTHLVRPFPDAHHAGLQPTQLSVVWHPSPFTAAGTIIG